MSRFIRPSTTFDNFKRLMNVHTNTHSNGPLCSNTVIGILVVDGWAVAFNTARRGLGGLRPRPVAVPNVTAQPSTASVGLPLFDVAL